jgi:hypothetical protein
MFLCSVQTGSGTHPASHLRGTRGSFPGGRRPMREVDHSAPSSAEVKNGGVIPLFLHMSSRHIT